MNDAPPVTRTPRSFHRSDIRVLDLSLYYSRHFCKQSGSLEAGCECPRPLAALSELARIVHGVANRGGDGAGIARVGDPSAAASGDELGRVAAGSGDDERRATGGEHGIELAGHHQSLDVLTHRHHVHISGLQHMRDLGYGPEGLEPNVPELPRLSPDGGHGGSIPHQNETP